MTHTLTGFMELMDHGIVSWENLSSVFIKKVLYMLLSLCLLLCVRFRFFTHCGCYSPRLPSLFRFLLPLLSDCQLCQRQAD